MTRIMPTLITRSHHFFTSAQRILGEERMATVFKKSFSQIYRWGADPERCDDPSRNPIDLMKIIFNDLQEVGRDDVVEGALRVLADSHGYTVEAREIRSDKASAMREMLDVNTALGSLAQNLNASIEDGRLDEDECRKLIALTAALIKQARELTDAISKRRI